MDSEVMYQVTKAEELAKIYDDIIVLQAVEASLPPEVVRIANPEGSAKLTVVCTNLREEFNAPMALYGEADTIAQWRSKGDEVQDEVLTFMR